MVKNIYRYYSYTWDLKISPCKKLSVIILVNKYATLYISIFM